MGRHSRTSKRARRRACQRATVPLLCAYHGNDTDFVRFYRRNELGCPTRRAQVQVHGVAVEVSASTDLGKRSGTLAEGVNGFATVSIGGLRQLNPATKAAGNSLIHNQHGVKGIDRTADPWLYLALVLKPIWRSDQELAELRPQFGRHRAISRMRTRAAVKQSGRDELHISLLKWADGRCVIVVTCTRHDRQTSS